MRPPSEKATIKWPRAVLCYISDPFSKWDSEYSPNTYIHLTGTAGTGSFIIKYPQSLKSNYI